MLGPIVGHDLLIVKTDHDGGGLDYVPDTRDVNMKHVTMGKTN